ncbi:MULTISPECIES: hypothetical protein [Xanthomonas]|uniref:Peptidase n=1 Tax=Xanthomonas dyei TaxID=743699 RepID=A0ABZ0DAP3_9XANT|nr:hypothetical protein [Xanthomonas dyei]WOB24755.1 hypothetical protein NYR99_13195 [Xanthomonas dyei]WOB52383.1 hypothetical protein NYR95_13200 [Xanthomonas dyei]
MTQNDITPQEQIDTASADAAAAAATAENQQEAALPNPEDAPAADKLDAFSAGVEEARAQEADEPGADPAPAPAADTPAEEPKPQDPLSTEPAKEAPKPEEQPKSVDDEIKDLGITNERTQKRFRELTERAAEVEPLRTKAAKADEWEQTITSTGATPQQFGNALNYLAAINSKDPDAMAQAYDSMSKELQWLGQRIGREAPGFDPISAHADLAEKVASGDLTREVAAEMAQHRQRGVLQQEQRANQQQSYQTQQAEQTGLAQVQALGSQLKATDPAFAQKLPYLMPTVEIIQSTLPPDQWAAAVHNAYMRLPAVAAPAPAAPVARSANNPTRANAGVSLAAKPTKENAFEFGVAEARSRGV